MTQPSLVSVIIPAYNCAQFLASALDSVFAQTYKLIEVIVVDDGSTDASADIVHSYHDVVYVRQNNRGPSAARNAGVGIAQGEFIAFLDADDLWEPAKLTEQIAILDANPRAGLVFSDMRLFDESESSQPSMFGKYGMTADFFGEETRVVDCVRKLVRANFIPTSSVVVRRQALVHTGGFDEQYRKAEDWDMWLRIALHFPVIYSPKLLVLKRVHDVNVSHDAEGMNVAAVQVLEKFDRENHVILSRLNVDINSVLRDGYRNLGYFYLRQVSTAQARAAFWRSLQLGFQLRALAYLISTFLGPWFVDAVMRTRG